jgi:hypothetical protein
LTIMLYAPNDLVIAGAVTLITVTLAVEVFPAPPSVEETVTLLFLTPTVVPCTFKEKVHEALAIRVAPVRPTKPEPAAAIIVPPPQLPVSPLGVATIRPVGKLSAKETFVRLEPALGLVMLKDSDVEPLSVTLDAPNDVVIDGALAPITVTLAVEVLPVPPSVEETVTLLFFTPAVLPVTFTEKLHGRSVEALPGKMTPARATTLAPDAAIGVPPAQLLVSPVGVATTKPAGKLSTRVTLLRAEPGFGLVIVKDNDVVPLSGMLDAPNDCVREGGATTVSEAVEVVPVPPFVEVTVPVVLV